MTIERECDATSPHEPHEWMWYDSRYFLCPGLVVATDICALCRQPLEVNNDVCPSCRDGLMERAESYGGTPAAIHLRYVTYVYRVRTGTYLEEKS